MGRSLTGALFALVVFFGMIALSTSASRQPPTRRRRTARTRAAFRPPTDRGPAPPRGRRTTAPGQPVYVGSFGLPSSSMEPWSPVFVGIDVYDYSQEKWVRVEHDAVVFERGDGAQFLLAEYERDVDRDVASLVAVHPTEEMLIDFPIGVLEAIREFVWRPRGGPCQNRSRPGKPTARGHSSIRIFLRQSGCPIAGMQTSMK